MIEFTVTFRRSMTLPCKFITSELPFVVGLGNSHGVRGSADDVESLVSFVGTIIEKHANELPAVMTCPKK